MVTMKSLSRKQASKENKRVKKVKIVKTKIKNKENKKRRINDLYINISKDI